MKKILLLFFFIGNVYCQYTNLDSLYYTYGEIRDSLYKWQKEFGNNAHHFSSYQNSIIYKLDSIGFSTNENLPIYAVKLSVNANLDEDEPKVLILGQCHAEEIYGVEMSMAFIRWLLYPHETPWANNELPLFMNNLEVWVIPTHNPEGLNVVHGYCSESYKDVNECEENNGIWIQDISFRKNKTDVDLDGFFDYIPFYINGVSGEDEDGVDLNRNYGLNWIHGDAWKVNHPNGCSNNPGYESNFDYYRGSSPFSETETEAIKNFTIENNFILSVAYHSSRSGCVSERVIFPWAWGWKDHDLDGFIDSNKVSPDFNVISALAKNIAAKIEREGSSGSTYSFVPQKSLNGNAHDWIYAETGCIQFLIEMGSENIQPLNDINSQELINKTIENNRKGLFYILREAIASEALDSRHVSGVVTDKITGLPLEDVIVQAVDYQNSVLKPRLTNSFGRYHRLFPLGNQKLKFIKEGYYSKVINTGSQTFIDVSLEPLDQSEVIFIVDDYNDLQGEINVRLIDSLNNKLEFIINDQEVSRNLFNQNYSILIYGNSIIPFTSHINILSNDTLNLTLINKPIENTNYIDYWEAGDYWQINNGKLFSQNDQLYENRANTSTRMENVIETFSDSLIAIEIDLAYELEWENDSLLFNIFSSDTIIPVTAWTDQQWDMHTEYYVVQLEPNNLYGIEFKLITDKSIRYRGAQIDKINIYNSYSLFADDKTFQPKFFIINQSYPNPFNSIINIELSLLMPSITNIDIYNVLGKKVYTIVNSYQNVGSHKFIWDASSFASGIYFINTNINGFTNMQKIVLLK